MTGPCDIGVLADWQVYPHLNEVYAPKPIGELEVSKCQSVRLHNACAGDCECYLFLPGCGTVLHRSPGHLSPVGPYTLYIVGTPFI